MTNKDKALELTIKLEGEIGTSPHSREAIQDSILEMAEWKEQQMIDKAVEWLKSNCTYNDNGTEKCIVNLGFFIDDMKEE